MAHAGDRDKVHMIKTALFLNGFNHPAFHWIDRPFFRGFRHKAILRFRPAAVEIYRSLLQPVPQVRKGQGKIEQLRVRVGLILLGDTRPIKTTAI